MVILGIDPGLATMGYGVINSVKGNYSVIDYGVVTTPKECTLPERLQQLEDGVKELIETYKPDNVSIEELFFSKNITTGIPVAEARGVILLTAVKSLGKEVYEYTPNQIKQAVTGYGGASASQTQKRASSRRRGGRFGGCHMPRSNEPYRSRFQGSITSPLFQKTTHDRVKYVQLYTRQNR